MIILNRIFEVDGEDSFECKRDVLDEYKPFVVKAFEQFVHQFVLESLTPDWVGSIKYVSSSRVEVKRLYALDDQSEFTNLLREYVEERRNS